MVSRRDFLAAPLAIATAAAFLRAAPQHRSVKLGCQTNAWRIDPIVNWSGWAIIEEERLSGEKPGEKAVAPARQTLKQVFGR